MTATLLLVAAGGAIGSALRYLAVHAIGAPLATLAVNVFGSFAIGVLYVVFASRSQASLFLMTGILGGFTTFSAFSLDTLKLIEGGQSLQAVAYVAGSVGMSLAAVALGVALTKGFA